jgi:hypothetical protein
MFAWKTSRKELDLGTTWQLSAGNTITVGKLVRHAYWWPTADPDTGVQYGDWMGPQQALASPQPLRTLSNRVTTVSQGFQTLDQGNVYTADVVCENVGNVGPGEYDMWVQGMVR